ncbi:MULTISPECIES: hypothetical protein [Rothia]|uniref:hypothetical protein n=1 Tax=Rothia TaxID=32207 RepID=UPI0012940AEA|nr:MULTISPECIES: hypothetical protein [Rothia]
MNKAMKKLTRQMQPKNSCGAFKAGEAFDDFPFFLIAVAFVFVADAVEYHDPCGNL